ncbi:hypothetical protein [Teredinibacter purpureus]|uniref:hypothetical protein n=1 Tax=Teredinibacter purpureus TaxID=2731756 RepID=UPI0005F81D08|nr:hypothetical protein [Teredinibacter purpureus]
MRKVVGITQSINDFSGTKNKLYKPAFREWQYKLNRNDQLPRGKWFKDKKAGKPIMIMDEAHLLLGKGARINPMMSSYNL